MVVGETLMLLSGGPYYSPQFNRGGNAAVFPVEILQMAGGMGLALLVEVEHKNSDDTSWTSVVSVSCVAVTIYLLVIGGLKEQLRYKYTVSGAAPTDAVSFNVLAPQWRPY